jgi:hypothetical protein
MPRCYMLLCFYEVQIKPIITLNSILLRSIRGWHMQFDENEIALLYGQEASWQEDF